jgi:anti-sigma factor RsiW
MECSRFTDDKLSGEVSPEFGVHLASCPGCVRDLEEIGEVRRLYREASVERYRGGVPRLRRSSWLPAAAAAAAMIGVLFFLVTAPSKPVDPPAEAPPTAFFRVHLESWSGEERLDRALDDAWIRLAELERRQP